MKRLFTVLPLVAVILLAGCDSVSPDDSLVRPDISLEFIYADGTPAKTSFATNAVWTVSLDVSDIGGQDYSPEDITVDDATSQQAVFNVALPSDGVFRIVATLAQSGADVAAGGVISQITSSDSEITIPVFVGSDGVPLLGFIPSRVDAPAGSLGNSVEVDLMFFGPGTDAVGLAAEIETTGAAPEDIELSGATVRRDEDDAVALFWNFQEANTQPSSLGTMTVPVDGAGTCLEISEGGARTVTDGGAIVRQQTSTSFCLNRSL